MFAIEVETIIEGAVCEQKLDLDQTKQLIFKNLPIGELPHVADVKVIENCFIKVLISCACSEFEKSFSECCGDEKFVCNFIRRSDQISTLDDLISLYEPDWYVTHLLNHTQA